MICRKLFAALRAGEWCFLKNQAASRNPYLCIEGLALLYNGSINIMLSVKKLCFQGA
jgi:hypothetical protein